MIGPEDELAGWARAARDGDPLAVEHLVRATQRDVQQLCAYLVTPAAAEDLAQDTYMRALQSLDTYAGRSSFRVWLLGIARHVCIDALRAKERRARLQLQLRLRAVPAATAADPADEVSQRDLLQRLAPDRRTAFVLTQILALSYDEAAAVCGVPVGTIRSRVARARDDLQTALARRLA